MWLFKLCSTEYFRQFLQHILACCCTSFSGLDNLEIIMTRTDIFIPQFVVKVSYLFESFVKEFDLFVRQSRPVL